MTGREAVEYFANCLHNGKIQFLHFTTAPSRRYDPYNLISIPENKVLVKNIPPVKGWGLEYLHRYCPKQVVNVD